jgi:hypothetical protein
MLEKQEGGRPKFKTAAVPFIASEYMVEIVTNNDIGFTAGKYGAGDNLAPPMEL